jgi:DNA-binding GntR family transcriptional regulator
MAQHRLLLEIWDNLTMQAQHRLVAATTARKRQLFGVSPIPEIYAALERGDADTAIRISTAWSDWMLKVLDYEEEEDVQLPAGLHEVVR